MRGICITNKRKVINSGYKIHNKILQQTSKARYLGITMDSSLSWNPHVTAVTKKANNTVSFLQRNLSTCLKDVKATCYKTLVRPQLEYGSSVWDPPTKSNISKLVAVQHRTVRFCHSDYRHTSSVTAMMEDLGWEQLQTRRQQAKTIMLYRIVNQLVDIQAASLLIHAGTHTRGHANRFLVPYCSINAYKYSF